VRSRREEPLPDIFVIVIPTPLLLLVVADLEDGPELLLSSPLPLKLPDDMLPLPLLDDMLPLPLLDDMLTLLLPDDMLPLPLLADMLPSLLVDMPLAPFVLIEPLFSLPLPLPLPLPFKRRGSRTKR
jgi:hypothetical protein